MDAQGQNGLLSTYRESYRARGPLAWASSLALVALYLALYFEDRLAPVIGRPLTALGEAAGLRNRWYLYGLLYSVAMIGGAVHYLRRHGGSRYNRARIAVNVGVQVVLGFALPFVMPLFGEPELYASYFWPLKIEYLYPATLAELPAYFAVYTAAGALVAAPALALLFGKRWYCSWICGCGGLANTFGDPWRHLSSKSSAAWRFERWSVHAVLVVAVVSTALIAIDQLGASPSPSFHRWVSGERWDDLSVKYVYGLVVGSILAGVVGTGVYPLLGPRVWCRNFCPMAALLGLVQKLGRFRIRVKPDMCIACGNCSTYCEMGIDVRAYAMRNESFTRASCVGCGMCAHVCPRGVLRLESAPRRRPLPIAR